MANTPLDPAVRIGVPWVGWTERQNMRPKSSSQTNNRLDGQ